MTVFYTVRRNSQHMAMFGENDEQLAIATLKKIRQGTQKYNYAYACCRNITDENGRVIMFAVYSEAKERWNMDIDIDLVFGNDEEDDQ